MVAVFFPATQMRENMKALLGTIAPIKYSGKQLLKQSLKSYGVDVNRIPDECLQELTDKSIKLGKNTATMTKRDFSITQIVNFIEGNAASIAQLILHEEREDIDESSIEILQRYGVIKPLMTLAEIHDFGVEVVFGKCY
jgi:hypothetical protein